MSNPKKFKRKEHFLASVLRSMKIKALKKKARNLYTSRQYEMNRYDAGYDLNVYMNPRILSLEDELSNVLAELQKIDPEFPRR